MAIRDLKMFSRSMEFERLISAGGPTKGELIRPTDRKTPKSDRLRPMRRLAFGQKGRPYCSNICCMNTIKSTLVLKEHYPDMEIKVFYIDIRAFGKGFEDLYRKSRRPGRPLHPRTAGHGYGK